MRPWNAACGLDIATTSIRDPAVLAAIAQYGFRVVLHGDGTHFLHEAYYAEDGSLLGIARKPAEPCADTLDDLATVLEDMRHALAEPVLTYTDFAASAPSGR